MKKSLSDCYHLDPVGTFYPSVAGTSHPSMFGISVVLFDTIQPELLQQALERTAARFTSMNLGLQEDFFHYYLCPIEELPSASAAAASPCRPISKRTDQGFLYRVTYQARTISFEFFHVLTDSSGALTFIKTLLLCYERLLGNSIDESSLIVEPDSPVRSSETEEAATLSTFPSAPPSRPGRRAFHISGLLAPQETLHVICASVELSVLKDRCHSLGVSITEYLAAVYMHALYQIQQRGPFRQKPIRISIPADLRTFYPTDSMRAFSLFIRPEIDPRLGTYTFEEILRHVHHSIRFDRQKKHLASLINIPADLQRNRLIRRMPRIIKHLIGTVRYRSLGEHYHSGMLFNTGYISLPKALARCVERFDMIIGESRINTENCAVTGFRRHLCINFSRITQDPVVARTFLRTLSSQGVPVSIISEY